LSEFSHLFWGLGYLRNLCCFLHEPQFAKME